MCLGESTRYIPARITVCPYGHFYCYVNGVFQDTEIESNFKPFCPGCKELKDHNRLSVENVNRSIVYCQAFRFNGREIPPQHLCLKYRYQEGFDFNRNARPKIVVVLEEDEESDDSYYYSEEEKETKETLAEEEEEEEISEKEVPTAEEENEEKETNLTEEEEESVVSIDKIIQQSSDSAEKHRANFQEDSDPFSDHEPMQRPREIEIVQDVSYQDKQKIDQLFSPTSILTKSPVMTQQSNTSYTNEMVSALKKIVESASLDLRT